MNAIKEIHVPLCVANLLSIIYKSSAPAIFSIRGAAINVKQHGDKKPLEVYAKDSYCVHRWLPIEFINISAFASEYP